MMKNSVLKQQLMNSPLGSQSALRPKGSVNKKTLALTLTLTSLVDAFSILVIYLLVNTTAQTEFIEMPKGMELPLASTSVTLEATTVIKVENGIYFLDGKEISLAELPKKLYAISQQHRRQNPGESKSIIIQADKGTSFAALNPILASSAQTGLEQLKFAVVQKQGGS